MNIKNKHCVVTGAGRGLGRQIAMDLLAQKAIVHACDINDEALNDLKNSTNSANIFFYPCNVAMETEVQNFFAKLPDLDVLINNAGITRDGLLIKMKNNEISTMSLEDFQNVLQVNLGGVFLCGRAAASRMASKNGGVIINISSVSRHGNFGQTNYSASKAGVDAMTITWSKELARYHIRCAAIAPGYLKTEMTDAIKPEILTKITAQIPVQRLGKMTEISQTVSFIINNDFVNGKILEVDGGLRI